jgi:hypothetical protein
MKLIICLGKCSLTLQNVTKLAEARKNDQESSHVRWTWRNTEKQTDIHHLWIMAKRRGDALRDARNRGDRRNTQKNQTDICHLWIMARRRGDASGDARNRGGRRNASGDASLDNGKEEGHLHWATINRGGRKHALCDASPDNGKEEGDASDDASNAPPG